MLEKYSDWEMVAQQTGDNSREEAQKVMKLFLEAVKEGKLNVTFECSPDQGPKAAELIQRLESDISIDKKQYVEETYFDGTMDLDEIIENRTY